MISSLYSDFQEETHLSDCKLFWYLAWSCWATFDFVTENLATLAKGT